jgi:hypothetical protein
MPAPFEGHRQLIPLALTAVCLLTTHQAWAGANATAQNANGITVIPNTAGLAIGLNSMGRACAKIGAAATQDPAMACTGTNGPIPPNRSASRTDAAGNMASASATQLRIFGVGALKYYRVRASTTSVNSSTFGFAELVDPISISNPTGSPFSIDLTSFFMGENGDPGIELGGSGPLAAAAEITDTMSTSLTGLLYSLDLSFSAGNPLAIDLTLGSFVSGQPGWDKTALETSLAGLLGADSISSDYALSSFSFPAISIDVPAGQTLAIYSDDIALAQVPEPGTLALLCSAVLGLGLLRTRRG